MNTMKSELKRLDLACQVGWKVLKGVHRKHFSAHPLWWWRTFGTWCTWMTMRDWACPARSTCEPLGRQNLRCGTKEAANFLKARCVNFAHFNKVHSSWKKIAKSIFKEKRLLYSFQKWSYKCWVKFTVSPFPFIHQYLFKFIVLFTPILFTAVCNWQWFLPKMITCSIYIFNKNEDLIIWK